MSDRAAPKGYPQRKPLPPSSLRNEVDESKIQVPDSQVAVSETQSTTLMRESEPPLSPKSRKILAKNVSKPVGETRPSIEFPSPFISRPKISNELDFTFSNRKILPKMTRNPGMVLEQQPSDVLPPFPYARSPLSYSEQNALEKKLPKNAVEDMNPDSGRPEAQQVIASSESAKLQQNEDLTPDPNVTSEQNSGGHAELTATPVNEGLENRPEPILTNHTIHSEQMAGSSGLSAPKAKKSRRRKRQQRPPDMDSGKSKHMNHENTESVAVKEGNHIIAVSTESARDLKPSASMPHESQDLVIIPPGDSGREISDGKRKEVLCSTGDSHKEVPTGKNPIEITLPSPMVGVTDLRDANNDFGDPESVEEQVQINHVEVADQRRDDPQPSFSGLNVSDMGELSGAGPAYRDRLSEIRRSPHGVPRIDNTHRVIKRRKHTRTDRASPVAAQANEALLSVSPKYMPLLEVFARVLQEGDEAREAVAANIKTHETAVAALQDAAEAKSSTISVLEARNKKFQGDIERLKTGFQRLQKFHEGMENDYSSLKRHAKLHQEQCDRTLQRRLEEIEKEKAEWMEDLEHTLDAVNQSRRSTKAVLDDCFVQLTIAESRKADIEKRLNEQNGLLEEEKKRRQDLEKKILPTIQTMFGSADRRLERLSRRMHGIQQAQEAASSDQTQREYREKTQDALKLLLKASSLTTGHAEAAEKTLQGIGEKIDTKLTEMANSIAKNHSSGTELRQSIADQLRDFRNDMFQCGEAAKNHRQLQEENEELHRKYKEQQDTCTNLEKEISNFQQTESDLISQRSQLEKRLDYSERMKLSQYAEISNMRDELRSVGSNLQTRVDELAIAEKQIREQADNLSEAKRLKEIQDRKILEQARVINEIKSVQSPDNESILKTLEEQYELKLKERVDDLEHDIQTMRNERNEKEKELKDVQGILDATHESLRRVEKKTQELAVKLKTLEDEHHAAMDLKETNFTAEVSKLQQQLEQVSGALQLKESEYSSLKDENDELQRISSHHQECLDQSQKQLAEKQSEIDELSAKLDVQERKYREMSGALPELKSQTDVLKTQFSEAKKMASQAREREDKLRNDQLALVSEVEDLKAQLADAWKNCETKDIEIQGLHEEKQEEMKSMEERHEKELQEASNRTEAAEKARKLSEATIRRIEDESLGRMEAHKKIAQEKFELAVQAAVQERLAERHLGAPPPSMKKRVIRENTSTVETINSICTDVVPETQEFVVLGQRSGQTTSPRNRNSTSSLSEVPSDIDGEDDIIDMTEPAVYKPNHNHNREKLPALTHHFQRGCSQESNASFDAKANTGTRIVRQPPVLTGNQNKRSSHSQQSYSCEQHGSSDGSQDSGSSSYAPSSLSYTYGPKKKSRSQEANRDKNTKQKRGRDVDSSQKRKENSGVKRRNQEEHGNANGDKRACLRSSRPPSVPRSRTQGNVAVSLGNGVPSSSRKNKGFSQNEMMDRFNYELQTNSGSNSV